MYRNLVRGIITNGTKHLRAKVAFFRHCQALLKAETLIESWDADHKERKHLLSRQNPEIYPWGRRITPRNYRKAMHSKYARLEERQTVTQSALDEAFKRFDQRIEFIRSGMTWLAKDNGNSPGYKRPDVIETAASNHFERCAPLSKSLNPS